MVTISPESESDVAVREALLDKAFGPRRRRKTSERLRAGRLPAQGLAFAARNRDGRMIGTLRLWNVMAGSAGPALLLGPLAVDWRHRKRGIGAAMMRHAIAQAKRLGHGAILLVGAPAYYGRFGFSATAAEGLRMPGPVEAGRFLGLELASGALAGATGILAPMGRIEPADAAAPPRDIGATAFH